MKITSCNLSKFEMAQFNGVLFSNEKIRRCPIPFDDYYITSQGRVFSTKHSKIKELKQPTMENGYRCVCLHGSARPEVHYVHRMMIRAFYGIETNFQLQTRHLDGNKDNNCLDNLLPGTPQENAADKERHGTKVRGESIHSSKLNAKAVRSMRMLWELRGMYNVPVNINYKDIARIWNVTPATARKAIVGETWTHIE